MPPFQTPLHSKRSCTPRSLVTDTSELFLPRSTDSFLSTYSPLSFLVSRCKRNLLIRELYTSNTLCHRVLGFSSFRGCSRRHRISLCELHNTIKHEEDTIVQTALDPPRDSVNNPILCAKGSGGSQTHHLHTHAALRFSSVGINNLSSLITRDTGELGTRLEASGMQLLGPRQAGVREP